MTVAVRAPSVVGRFDELLGRPVSMRSLALLRVLAGPIVLLHLWPFLSSDHIYRDAFYEPYASWYPEFPRAVYIALLWVGAVAAVVMALGWFTRVATATGSSPRSSPVAPAHRSWLRYTRARGGSALCHAVTRASR